MASPVMQPEPNAPEDEAEPPPFLGSWARVYTVVLCYVALLIAVLAIGSSVLSRGA